MSDLGDKQRKLCRILNALESFVFALGYDLVREDAKRNPKVHGKFGVKIGYSAAYSVHKLKLAGDYSLFKGDIYITGKEADNIFGLMHDVGDKLGLAKRINGDLRHFSMECQGYR